jgi:hypothetical protein
MATMIWKTTLCISGPILCGLVYKLIKKKMNEQCDSSINKVLFYGPKNEETKETGLDNLFCIYYVLTHATRTVDVCLPRLHNETINNCLMTLQQKKTAKIRIAIHNSNQMDNLKWFVEHGVEVKIIRAPECLQHEFILVDASGDFKDSLAVLGSLDYEATRINCNRDITMLTSERKVVTGLKTEFERIWNSTPDTYCE